MATLLETPVRRLDLSQEPPVALPGTRPAEVVARIADIALAPRAPTWWYVATALCALLVLVLTVSIAYLLYRGVGIWGILIPVAWGFAIANFVWWIGIGHAGTLISAILLLLRQDWRESINRFAETMTLFAVMCAGLFPLLHLGRPWFFYWLFPYPSQMWIWPQFRSPLVWDFFAVSTYFTVSLIFWYLGLIPDLAALRDRARTRRARVAFGILAVGWRGSAAHWQRYRKAYLLLAGLATPLVVSVHSVVSLDFAYAQVPGWHSTIFPPYFVAGAIYSGFAVVLDIAIALRALYRLHDIITLRHLENCAKLLLAVGMIVLYAYVMEAFMAWYSGNLYELYLHWNRALGPYATWFWAYIFCNVVVVQAVWFRPVRRSPFWLFVIGLLVNTGMWIERVVIVIVSLNRDFLPSSWGFYWPTVWDWATLVGTVGFFTLGLCLFIRYLPIIPMSETAKLLTELRGRDQTP
jgi:molybdopterin-containing oxidoreductase family membrane subunit